MKRDKLIRRLTDLQFKRNDMDLHRGTFRVQGDTMEIVLASEDTVIRLRFFGDEIEKIERLHAISHDLIETMTEVMIFPAKHFVTPEDKVHEAIERIREELRDRLSELRKQGKVLEAARLEQRTNFDLEMLTNTGFVAGIENYSRQMEGRLAGEPPSTLIDYFPDDFLLFIDESHQTVPQIGAMYEGDRSRKTNLVDYGFRLPSAMDNRPLKFPEFEAKVGQTVYVSATPSAFEIKKSLEENYLVTDKKKKIITEDLRGITIVEQINRPTGLLDPTIELQPIEHQVDHLLEQIKIRVARQERVIVTTLSKRMAEELTQYIGEAGIKAQYLHSDVETFDRLEILRDLRLGVYDVIIGINLLREGLDLPEVSLVAILDADKEAFLRSETSFMQIMGRAARHLHGHVIMYADRITKSMQAAIDETTRRRKVQEAYNTKHGIVPRSTKRDIGESRLSGTKVMSDDQGDPATTVDPTRLNDTELKYYLEELNDRMELAAQNLEFELAASLRDRIEEVKKAVKLSGKPSKKPRRSPKVA
jgi:excinuclease ABC subunit B